MQNLHIDEATSQHFSGLPSSFCEPLWYAAYTNANHEKRVAEQLALRSLEHFLPVYNSIRRWKDRRVNLQMPLFPGYVFVRLPLRDRLRVLEISGVARLVGFGGTICALPAGEIEALRTCVLSGVRVEPHPYLTAGRLVRMTAGPLMGTQGVLIRRKGKSRVVISIDLIQRSVAVDADVADVEPVTRSLSRSVVATGPRIASR